MGDLSVQEWFDLFKNKYIFKDENMLIMRRFLDIGGAATCSQLSRRYGDEWTYYNLMCSKLAKRIANKKNIELDHRGDDSEIRWPVLFTGENVSHKDDIDGAFLWILKPNLKAALEQVDMSKYEPLYNDDADLIENIDELRANINRFEELKAQDGFDIKQLNSVNRSSKHFLRYEKNGKACFVNSKIIGYRIHDDVFARRGYYGDGNKTSHRIDEILGKRTSNLLYEEELKQFWSDQNIGEWKGSEEYKFWSIDKMKQYFVARISGKQNVFEDSLQHNYWRMQKRYDHEINEKASVTNNLKAARSVNKGDVLLLVNDGNIYAYGIVKEPPKEFMGHLCLQTVIDNGKHEYFDGVGNIHFNDCQAYYEKNYAGCNSDWSQYIDVEEWKSRCCEHPVNVNGLPDAKIGGFLQNLIVNVKPEWAKQKIKELDEQFEKNKPEEVKMIEEMTKILNLKKNIILQGAPGTGKTYNTAALALSTIKPNFSISSDHKDVMEEYKKHLIKIDDDGRICNDGQIGFVTFHQSMDYEDFVEGIKPECDDDSDDNNISYRVQPGVFKAICQKAGEQKTTNFEDAYNNLTQQLISEGCVGDEKYLTLETGGRQSKFGISLNKKGNLKLWTGKKENEYKSQGVLTRENIIRAISGEKVFEGWEGYSQSVINYLKEKFGLNITQNSGTKNFVLIIDEINRGNVSKIFGELISLLESDKRVGGDHPLSVTLPYSKESFSVPPNLYIIGTMNTTDRSVGSIDYAVRRRFAFVTLKASENAIENYYKGKGETLKNKAIELYGKVKDLLSKKDNLSNDMEFDDLMVGHSYFMAKTLDDLNLKWKYEVIPLLKEYQKDGLLRHSIDIENALKVENQETKA